jgi:hypothetical protein
MRVVQCWQQLRGRDRAAHPMHVCCWICLDRHFFRRLCHNHGHVHDDWLWRRQRVRGWGGAASRLYLQSWLRVRIDDVQRLCWCHWHMRVVWGWLQLCR